MGAMTKPLWRDVVLDRLKALPGAGCVNCKHYFDCRFVGGATRGYSMSPACSQYQYDVALAAFQRDGQRAESIIAIALHEAAEAAGLEEVASCQVK